MEYLQDHNPNAGQLTRIKQILTDNKRLSRMMTNYLNIMNGSALRHVYHYLNQTFEYEQVTNLQHKKIADIFEALVAAIYFDSGFNLDITWKHIKPCIKWII